MSTEENQIPEQEEIEQNLESDIQDEILEKSEKELKLEYEKILKELSHQIRSGNELLQILEPLTKQGGIYKGIFEVLANKFEQIKNDIKTSKGLNTSLQTELEKSKKEIDNFLSSIQAKITEVKTHNKEIESLKITAKRRTEVIENLRTKAEENKLETTNLKDSIKTIFKALSSIEKDANKLYESIKLNSKKSDNDIKSLNQILSQANTKSKELETFYRQGKQNFEHINTQKRKVDELEKISREKTNQITGFFSNLFESKADKKSIQNDIIESFQKIKAQQTQVDELLENATSLRLSGAFKEKEIELKIKLEKWERWIFLLVSGIISINFGLIFIPKTLNFDIFQHIGIISPLIVLLFFVLLEHSRVKKILDTYSFKYIESFTMPAFTELFENRGEYERSINFMEETIKDIYTNPSEKVNENAKSNILDYIFDFAKEFKGYFGNFKDFKFPKIEGNMKVGKIDVTIKEIEK